jgi:hypothetical protein
LELISNVSIGILWSAESSVMAESMVPTGATGSTGATGATGPTEIVTKNISTRLGRPIDTPNRLVEQGSTLIPRLGFASNESVQFFMQNFYIRRIV